MIKIFISIGVVMLITSFTHAADNPDLHNKMFRQFVVLGPGRIQPDGWLRTYTQAVADGWPLLYAQEKSPYVYGRYWNKFTVKAWFDGAPDYPAYFGDGMIRLSAVLPDSSLAKEVDPWLKQVLASQEPDGYLGALNPPSRWNQWIDVFSQACMIRALVWQYRVSGDEAILKACEKSADRMVTAFGEPDGKVNKQVFSSHGTYITRAMRDLYEVAPKPDYADLAKKSVDMAGRVPSFLAYLDNKGYDYFPNLHSVVEVGHIAYPAMVYEMTGEEKYLKAAVAGWEMIQQHVTVDGQTTGHEYITKVKPRAIGEHCTAVEWALTNQELLRITGEVRYADAVERAVFNAYPGSKSPDTICAAYMHSPNQLVASEWSHPHYDDYDGEISREYYSTAHLPLCCNVISPREMPYYIDNMVLETEKGLAVALFGPAKVKAKLRSGQNVEIIMDTRYPFEDSVKLTINPDKESRFEIKVRIPGWCSSAALEVNGKKADAIVEPGQFAVIDRSWRKGDIINLIMDVPITFSRYPATAVRVEGTAVLRGPLTFVLPVDEDWRKIQNPPIHHEEYSPGTNRQYYRVLVKDGSTWNYALVIDKDNPQSSFKLKLFPRNMSALPWTKPVLGLEVQAKRVLNWEMEGSQDHPMTPGLPIGPMKLSEEKTTLTLIPFGCTRLRLSYLPTVNE